MAAGTDADDLTLARTGLDGDRRRLAAGDRISPELAKVLLAKGDDDTLFALARNPASPRSALRKLRAAERSGTIGRVFRRRVPQAALARVLASNPALPATWLRAYARHLRWDVRAVALCNPSMPAGDVRRHLRNEIWGVCSIVAASSTDGDLLRELATHEHPGVCAAVADNPAAPADAVAAAREAMSRGDVDASRSPDWRVRAEAAAQVTSGRDSDRFAVDPHPKVRLASLEGNLRVLFLAELTDDVDFDVAERAAAKLEALPRGARKRGLRGLLAPPGRPGAGRPPTI